MGIELSIIAGQCYSSSGVNAAGADRHPVSGTEIGLFGLDGEAFNEAVAACLGRAPDRIQFDGLLHSTHGWAPVTTTLRVQSASVTGVGSEPVSLLIGTGDAPLTCTVVNRWSPVAGISPRELLRYHIQLPGGEELDVQREWGGETIESASTGRPPGAPGDELLALRMDLGVRIVYDAYLTGDIGVHYRDAHQGHHSWGLEIGTVLAAGGLLNGRHFAENLNIRYHTSGRVVHADANGGVVTLTGPGIRAGADLALITA